MNANTVSLSSSVSTDVGSFFVDAITSISISNPLSPYESLNTLIIDYVTDSQPSTNNPPLISFNCSSFTFTSFIVLLLNILYDCVEKYELFEIISV